MLILARGSLRAMDMVGRNLRMYIDLHIRVPLLHFNTPRLFCLMRMGVLHLKLIGDRQFCFLFTVNRVTPNLFVGCCPFPCLVDHLPRQKAVRNYIYKTRTINSTSRTIVVYDKYRPYLYKCLCPESMSFEISFRKPSSTFCLFVCASVFFLHLHFHALKITVLLQHFSKFFS